MSKHTPGPWCADKIAPYIMAHTTEHGHIHTVAIITEEGTGLLEGNPKANKHLIAAAPDLLAACKEAATYLTEVGPLLDAGYPESGCDEIIAMLTAAAAKTEGGQK